jgi:nitrate reductase gamma subunit
MGEVAAALLAVLVLASMPALGVGLLRGHLLFGVIVPWAAMAVFIWGFLFKVIGWLASPVPFPITTVAGQQRSLPWIKAQPLESPSTRGAVLGRMALEILLFRSLARNDRIELKRAEKLVYGSSRYLWLGALMFHWSLFFILFRHLRFFTQPVFPGVAAIEYVDGAFKVNLHALFATDVLAALGLIYLFARRLFSPQVRAISLPADYFSLFLIIAVVATGILMRQGFYVDVFKAKELAMGLATFHPALPRGIGTLFYVHLFLASVLFAYFPFSKLMHGPGVFLSPTRNLRNDSRARRHANPWDHPVKVHTYEEWEDEFRTAMKGAGMPVEKE